jgi:hypothetical protein
MRGETVGDQLLPAIGLQTQQRQRIQHNRGAGRRSEYRLSEGFCGVFILHSRTDQNRVHVRKRKLAGRRRD